MWLAVMVASTLAAWACSCAALDPRKALRQADAAFIGALVSRDEPQPSATGVVNGGQVVAHRFTVERSVKGGLGPTVTVFSSASGAACGLEVRPGHRTGLFLHLDNQGQWLSGLCSQVEPGRLLEADRPFAVPAALATGLLIAVATAARRSVRRSG